MYGSRGCTQWLESVVGEVIPKGASNFQHVLVHKMPSIQDTHGASLPSSCHSGEIEGFEIWKVDFRPYGASGAIA